MGRPITPDHEFEPNSITGFKGVRGAKRLRINMPATVILVLSGAMKEKANSLTDWRNKPRGSPDSKAETTLDTRWFSVNRC